MTAPEVHEIRLENGFRALLVERRSLPVVTSMLWYQVGSRDERTGETGLSHFLEHMMFKGTDKYGKGEIDLQTILMGGSNNAFTDNDSTGYYFSLASDRWQSALEIEASRMRGCLLDEAEFQAEKSVVLEELAMGEDDPWRVLFQATESLVFQVHPYHHPVIGWRQDVERLGVQDMRDYYRRHYGPNRAFLVVVGDIDLADTTARIQELFGPMVPTVQPRAEVLAEPRTRGERRAVLRFPGQTTRMAVAVPTCCMGEEDDFVLDVICTVLGAGKGSRLSKRLVLEKEVATDISVYNETRLDPGAFWFTFELREGVEPEQVEGLLVEELESVMRKGFTAPELRRAKTQLESGFLFEEETTLDSATKIGRFEATSKGGYKRLAEVLDLISGVSSKMVKETARKYFQPDAWRVVWSLPTDLPKAKSKAKSKARAKARVPAR